MSNTTQNINKITGTVIAIAIRVIIAAIIIFVLIKGVKICYDFGHDIFYETTMEEAPGRDIQIMIPDGCSPEKAADILESKGLISNKLAFRIQAKVFELEITPGAYTFNTSTSARAMLEQMNRGPEEVAND